MTSPEFEMSVPIPCIVYGPPVCDLGQEWSWVFGERVEGKAVDRQEYELQAVSIDLALIEKRPTYVMPRKIEKTIEVVNRPKNPADEAEDSILSLSWARHKISRYHQQTNE